MAHKYTDVLVEKKDQIAWITINRPDRYNSVDGNTFMELNLAFEEVGDDSKIGVVVITGAGEKSFCAGGYLKDLTKFDVAMGRKLYNQSEKLFNTMRRIPQPVVGAINGYAVGGGNEIVIACDLAIAAENAKFGQTGPKIGSSPIFGANNLLAMTIGEKRAREVCYLNRLYTAQEAYQMGWVNKVVPLAQLKSEVQTWCEEMLDRSPAYLELTKINSNVWWDMLQPVHEHAKQVLLRLAGGAEMTEGATAFMEKRKPNFRQFRK
jgi:2-ketocyclohexanecarboxyl-CoA hydrolase